MKCQDAEEKRLPYPWLWTLERDSKFKFTNKEFSLDTEINAEGFQGKLFSIKKNEGEFRILFLGDSFTFGIGSPRDKSFVNVVESYLSEIKTTKQIQIMNAGIPGSDPIFYLQILKRQMLKYKPDLVVMMINSSDVIDIARRGGNERFDDFGNMKPRERPWYYSLYTNLHLFRAVLSGVLHYDFNLMSPQVFKERTNMSIELLTKCGVELEALAKEENFKKLIIFHPYPIDIMNKHVPHALLTVKDKLKASGVESFDITPDMASRISAKRLEDLYWPIDLHFNQEGYKEIGISILKLMAQTNVLPIDIKTKLKAEISSFANEQ